jgi:hypothetical protein
MDMTQQQIHQAFLNTTFRVISTPSFNIKINTIIPEAQHLNSWAFLTAWNPLPEILSDVENKKRNQQLEDDLKSLSLVYCNAIGISEDEKWSEESFFIENISKAQIQTLAIKYRQLAYVYGSKNEVATLVYTLL